MVRRVIALGLGDVRQTFVVVDRFEYFLGRDQKVSHFPNGHLEVHLLEVEDFAKEGRHPQLGSPTAVGYAILSRN